MGMVKKIIVLMFILASSTFATPVDPKKDISLVLIPWPCPTQEMSIYVDLNMKGIIHTLPIVLMRKEMSYDIIVVKAPYASKENQAFDTNSWWYPSIRKFRNEMETASSIGIVRFINTLSDETLKKWEMTSTPSYFLFENGKLVKSGNIVSLLDDLGLSYNNLLK